MAMAMAVSVQILPMSCSRPPHIHVMASTPLSRSRTSATRRALCLLALTTSLSTLQFSVDPLACRSQPQFVELPDSGGVRALDLRVGDGDIPGNGDKVAIHYYGRLAAKQGWRFDSTYDHKDPTGDPIPFEFILGSGKVISGIESAVRSMRIGGIRRIVVPPSEGYQNTSQEPIPPNLEMKVDSKPGYPQMLAVGVTSGVVGALTSGGVVGALTSGVVGALTSAAAQVWAVVRPNYKHY